MPSRLVVFTIVFLWLSSASWLLVREILPLYRAGEPPAFFTDVVAEVRGSSTAWRALHKGKNVGWGFSQIKPLPNNRTFELFSELKFDDFVLVDSKHLTIHLKKLYSRIWIDRGGNLKKLTAGLRIATPEDIQAEIEGLVQNGVFTPTILVNGQEASLGPLQPKPIDVPTHGNLLNTHHPLDKIQGLWVGRTWKVPLLDEVAALLPGGSMSSVTLIAEVHDADLQWQGHLVPCFRIDYQEPGKKAVMHTYVRRSDGLVLQQETNQNEMDLVLVREVTQ